MTEFRDSEPFGASASLGLRRIRTTVVLDRTIGSQTVPEVSVIIPMYRREGRAKDVLGSLASSLRLLTEVIVVEDASPDSTLSEVLAWANGLDDRQTSIVRVVVLRNRWAHFETYCDVVGFKLATSPYLIEVQADMRLADVGFDCRMVLALRGHEDIVALSGRGVHPFDGLRAFRWEPWVFGRRTARMFELLASRRRNQSSGLSVEPTSRHDVVLPDDALFRASGHAGRLSTNVEHPIDALSTQAAKIWIGDTVMRGPLAFHRERYEAVGGFDTRRFFLGNDDHDFCARALRAGYRVGFTPVNFVSSLQDGTIRQRKSNWTRARIAALLVRQRLLFQTSDLARYFKDGINMRKSPEVRPL